MIISLGIVSIGVGSEESREEPAWNMMMLLGALGGVILVIIAFALFLRRKRMKAAAKRFTAGERGMGTPVSYGELPPTSVYQSSRSLVGGSQGINYGSLPSH